ncbi:MAG: glycerol-3-phosphate 1-O-acyltransferase PlsY [Dehalococcoidia bacterium]|nr:glycerol-3-phosphate 1-O-acyltransferase PlsY [Dehalococcoidia bacterium]
MNADLFYLILFMFSSYMIGSIQFGIIVSRILGKIDVREYGSGKTGTTNILRTLGVVPAILVIILDILKGAIPVVIANAFFDNELMTALGALCVIIGHCWPAFSSFKGGRGVASAFGVFIIFAPYVALIILFLGILIIIFTKYVSLASIITVFLSSVAIIFMVFLDYLSYEVLFFAVPTAILIEINHLDNMKRLIRGTESKFGQKVKIKKKND